MERVELPPHITEVSAAGDSRECDPDRFEPILIGRNLPRHVVTVDPPWPRA
jgi:hypothetical protein